MKYVGILFFQRWEDLVFINVVDHKARKKHISKKKVLKEVFTDY